MPYKWSGLRPGDGCGTIMTGLNVWFEFRSRVDPDAETGFLKHACSAKCFGRIVGSYFGDGESPSKIATEMFLENNRQQNGAGQIHSYHFGKGKAHREKHAK